MTDTMLMFELRFGCTVPLVTSDVSNASEVHLSLSKLYNCLTAMLSTHKLVLKQ